ncbi:MAG TPA: hypothetical protein VFB42_01785 [Gaiellaceae bacterium]|nr:hypothetical protein [Gaiellaceae bacterium]
MARARLTLHALAAVAALATAAPALADEPKHSPDPQDQALARNAVVRLSDFAPGSGWTGGPRKPGGPDRSGCKLRLKQSDLVETGDAESSFMYRIPIVQVFSDATVYRTERMARLSWERARPGLLGYLRCLSQRSLGEGVKVVSVKPMSFPRVGSYGSAYETVFDLTSAGETLRMVIHVEVFGSGRTLMLLMQFAPYASAEAAKAGEARLAALMTARLRALVA